MTFSCFLFFHSFVFINYDLKLKGHKRKFRSCDLALIICPLLHKWTLPTESANSRTVYQKVRNGQVVHIANSDTSQGCKIEKVIQILTFKKLRVTKKTKGRAEFVLYIKCVCFEVETNLFFILSKEIPSMKAATF